MKRHKVKKLWGFLILIALGVVIFNNFNQAIIFLEKGPWYTTALLLGIISAFIYGYYNRKELFK